jgi:BirA family transcriptional regulator, biotin operon repressor / biotin---[acetyl-CoA-carboxylase] ligase
LTSSLPDDLRVQPVPLDIRDAWDRAGARLGRFAPGLHYLGTVSSTNDLALRLAATGAVEGTTLVADAQTAGRGRRGRHWFSPSGSGLYLSVILSPRDGDPSAAWIASRLSIVAGVALAEGVLASTGLPAQLKWPNDLVVERRKVAGILAEMSAGAPGRPSVVLGIGINIATTSYPRELMARATSIETELGRPVDRALVLTETLAALSRRYEDLQAGLFDAILTAWRALAPSLPGAAIEWDGPQGVIHGRAIDIDHEGRLLAQTDAGIVRLVAGEVRWR